MSDMMGGLRSRQPQRPQLTKADIDGLVDALPRAFYDNEKVVLEEGGYLFHPYLAKRHLYKAAGLQADGSPKPEKVRCWLVESADGANRQMCFSNDPIGSSAAIREGYRVIPGTFVADGAE